RDVPEERLDQFAQVWLDVLVIKVRPHEPHAAIDVIADAAGGDDAALIRVGRADAADAEAVAPVDVWHRQAGDLDTGKERDVGDLLGSLVLAELIDQPLVGENEAVDAHALLVVLRDAEAILVDLFERSRVGFLDHGKSPW